jgi:hypothetical protein
MRALELGEIVDPDHVGDALVLDELDADVVEAWVERSDAAVLELGASAGWDRDVLEAALARLQLPGPDGAEVRGRELLTVALMVGAAR